MSMMDSTKRQDRNNEHYVESIMLIVSVLFFCGVHHACFFCRVFLWSSSCSLFLSCVFVESIMLIVSVLCFCGVHHAHCFCPVFLWSPSCSLFLSCVFVESIMLIVSVLCFCGVHHAHCFCLVFLWSPSCSLFLFMMNSTKTQDRNNEHDGLHKNTRQKQ
jgi:archaellum biogenesis protein FlaJ (TadC family)